MISVRNMDFDYDGRASQHSNAQLRLVSGHYLTKKEGCLDIILLCVFCVMDFLPQLSSRRRLPPMVTTWCNGYCEDFRTPNPTLPDEVRCCR